VATHTRRSRPRAVLAAVLTAAALALTACSSNPASPPVSTTVAASQDQPALQVGTIATGLDVPWGLGFLPDGTALITGRDDATVSSISADGTVRAVGTIDGVAHGGEGGLLGIAVSPGFTSDNRLYVYYTAQDGNRIDTVLLRDGRLTEQRTGLSGIPKAGIHNGGRMTFGPDGLLYVGTGDAGDRDNAQNADALGGKILRLTADLQPAPGNPGGGPAFTLGHRNVQGLAFDDSDQLWAAEFGQNTWDELNLITAGGNYGWPDEEGIGNRPGFVDPQQVWPTSEASPSGIAVWRGSIWMAGLRGQQLWEIPIRQSAAGPTTGTPIAHLTGTYGRLRTVTAAPDGSLWLTTSNTDGRGSERDGDDRILRLQIG
jgi:glucose/arabinose dehydrogenase